MAPMVDRVQNCDTTATPVVLGVPIARIEYLSPDVDETAADIKGTAEM
jgi:hypothetical protein